MCGTSFIEGVDLGKENRIRCVAHCLQRHGCYAISFLPEGGSTRLGICVLQVTSGGQVTPYEQTTNWKNYDMSGSRCDD